jgi:dipeptidyl aminopeptidase/acylaminoacyl peptidase
VKRLALALLALPLAAASPNLTIDQLLSSPFPSDLVAQSNGDAVAWVSDAAGIRNIFVARAPDFKPVRITKFNADDGQEISDISWRKDGSAFVFSRGKEVWLGRETAPTHKLGDGHSPAISPDGGFAAWIQKGQVWVMPPIGKPFQLFEDRGEDSELTWSPDSARLAFTSTRSDHAFIGIYDLKNKALSFPDPSVDTDRSPSWSPDGSKLAFIRVPAYKDPTGWGQSPKPTGQPWSIRIIDTKPHELWKAGEGMGSVYWSISAAHQLMWTANGRIVFAWEHDGWQHLYTIPVAGGESTLLTPGNFEVEHATLSVDGNSVVFSSNQGDLDRKHLWQVSLDGEAPRILTAGQGIEWQPAALSSNRVALIHSDAKTPAQVGVLINSQIRDLAPIQPWPLGEPKPVINKGIHYQLFLPTTEGKHPAVIFFHGGPRRQMLLGWNEMQYYHQAYAFNQYLVSKGYVVLSVNYHSGVGYGLNFREFPNYGATGASEYPDVVSAGEYLRTRDDVDGDRIGLWGGSYGGYLTALGLARNSNMFKAGVDLHGIHDWNLELPVPISTAFGSSPLAAIKMWRSPVLIIQGDDDHNVNFANSVQVIEALRKQGVPFEQLIFPDEVHDFTIHAHWLASYRAAETFLDKYLKP